MSNPLGKVITKNSGRRLVIGDIHGCLKTLEGLLAQFQPEKDDQLFLLGDYVNKGPKSRKTVDYLLSLRGKYEVHFLLGNHDLLVLNHLENKDKPTRDRLIELKNEDFFDLTEGKKEKYLQFFAGLHHYFILDHFLLVHAGFDFTLANPFLGTETMINTREFFYDLSKAQGKTIIHGHFPHELTYIRRQIDNKSKIIPLDNGCVYSDRDGQGNLLGLDLDTNELWVQPRLD